MDVSESDGVKKTLQNPELHDKWTASYRTAENERFFELAFDHIVSLVGAPKGATFLDAGCGSCAHTMRLIRRGYLVVGIDFSDHILSVARENLERHGVSDKVILKQEDILALSFPNETFDYCLCWGVLMHIPDLERAISELARVLKPGGALVISESNMCSLQAVGFRALKRLLRRERATVVKTAAGMEYWHSRPSGKLLTRQANMGWMKLSLEGKGLTVRQHVSGQFTELYTILSSPLARKCIHGVNNFWFKYVKIPYFSFGNILILQKGT